MADRTSRRGTRWTPVVALVVVGLLAWWVLAHDGPAPVVAAPGARAPGADAMPATFELPPRAAGAASPREPLPEPGAPGVAQIAQLAQDPPPVAQRGERVVAVEAVTPDERPLLAALWEQSDVAAQTWNVLVTRAPASPRRTTDVFDLPAGERAGRFDNIALARGRRAVDELLGYAHAPEGEGVWLNLVWRQVVLASVRAGPDDGTVRFVLPVEQVLARLGAVRLRVVAAEDGRPLDRVRVAVFASFDIYEREPAPDPQVEGALLIDRLPPGPTLLVVRAPRREHERVMIVVPEARGLDVGTIALEAEIVVEGRVLDAHGDPRAGHVYAVPLGEGDRVDPTRLALGQVQGARVAGDGRFALHGLGPGRQLLVAQSSLDLPVVAADWKVVELRAGAPEREVELRCGEVARLTLDAAWRGRGFERVSLRREGDGVSLDLALDEVYGDVGLPAGRYRLQASGPKGRELVRELTLAPGAQTVGPDA